MTDVGRLHKAILNWDETFSTRCSGKTTIILHSIIGEIQIGAADHVFLMVEHNRNLYSIKNQLMGCLINQGLILIRETKNGGYKHMVFENENKKRINLFFIMSLDGKHLQGYHNYAVYTLDW